MDVAVPRVAAAVALLLRGSAEAKGYGALGTRGWGWRWSGRTGTAVVG